MRSFKHPGPIGSSHVTLIKTLMHRLVPPSLSILQEASMSHPRQTLLIRTLGTLCADLAVGVTVASSVSWVIQAASLGLFLSFLSSLVGLILALALSQYVVHPLASVLLSDQKLDLLLDAVGAWTRAMRAHASSPAASDKATP